MLQYSDYFALHFARTRSDHTTADLISFLCGVYWKDPVAKDSFHWCRGSWRAKRNI